LIFKVFMKILSAVVIKHCSIRPSADVEPKSNYLVNAMPRHVLSICILQSLRDLIHNSRQNGHLKQLQDKPKRNRSVLSYHRCLIHSVVKKNACHITAHIRHHCKKTTVLSCHRCLINTVEHYLKID
jgi:hypothetical protein